MNDDARKPLMLVVEDSEDWRQMLRLLLEPLDCRLEMRETLDEAFEFADAHDAESNDPIDLVILDWRVPDKADGAVDVKGGAAYLRRYNFLPRTAPIIVFTAYPNYDECIEVINEGADYYLPKSEPGGVDNSQKLLDKCKELLKKPEERIEKEGKGAPSDEWFERNHEAVREQHAGNFAAFILASETFSVDPAVSVEELDGVKILGAKTHNELRRCILGDSTLRQLQPLIVHIEGSGK